jgi:hypothetical protein
MGWPGLRAWLALVAAAIATTSTVLLVALGAPLAAKGALSPPVLAALAALGAAAAAALGTWLLVRVVARPIDRLLTAAASL